jgi:hypothetical protein
MTPLLADMCLSYILSLSPSSPMARLLCTGSLKKHLAEAVLPGVSGITFTMQYTDCGCVGQENEEDGAENPPLQNDDGD